MSSSTLRYESVPPCSMHGADRIHLKRTRSSYEEGDKINVYDECTKCDIICKETSLRCVECSMLHCAECIAGLKSKTICTISSKLAGATAFGCGCGLFEHKKDDLTVLYVCGDCQDGGLPISSYGTICGGQPNSAEFGQFVAETFGVVSYNEVKRKFKSYLIASEKYQSSTHNCPRRHPRKLKERVDGFVSLVRYNPSSGIEEIEELLLANQFKSNRLNEQCAEFEEEEEEDDEDDEEEEEEEAEAEKEEEDGNVNEDDEKENKQELDALPETTASTLNP